MTAVALLPDTARDIAELDCVEWHLRRGADGYGRVNRYRWPSPRLAHRHVWEECFGPIPAGAVIDHLCGARACVNPFHLVLRRDDLEHKRAHAARRTHCRRGHAYADHGRRHAATGWRYCRLCENQLERERRRARA